MNRVWKILFLGVWLGYSGIVSAQVLATSKNDNETSRTSAQNAGNKTQESTLFDEKGAPNFVAKVSKNNVNKKNDQKKKIYERSVYSFKIVDGEVVMEDTPRSILVSYDNYKINRGFGSWMSCSLRIYILNDMPYRISNIGLKLIWPEIETAIHMNQIEPGVKAYKDITLLGDGCLTMDKIPNIEVNRCRLKKEGSSFDECADAVRWFTGKS